MLDLINKYLTTYINNELPINLDNVPYNLYSNMIDDLKMKYYSINGIDTLNKEQQTLISELSKISIILLIWEINNTEIQFVIDDNEVDENFPINADHIKPIREILLNSIELVNNIKYQ